MFKTNFEFSLLASGPRTRVLVAPIDRHTEQPGTAQALLTTDPSTAEALVDCLRRLTTSRWTLLQSWATAHPGVRCELRRAVGNLMGTSTDPKTVADGPLAPLSPLLVAASSLEGASRGALRGAVLSLLEGCDDIPVRVRVEPEHIDDDATVYANHWLAHEATDDDVRALLAGAEDIVHDSLQWTLREQNPWLEDWFEQSWAAITTNPADLHAWVTAHRAHLLA